MDHPFISAEEPSGDERLTYLGVRTEPGYGHIEDQLGPSSTVNRRLTNRSNQYVAVSWPWHVGRGRGGERSATNAPCHRRRAATGFDNRLHVPGTDTVISLGL